MYIDIIQLLMNNIKLIIFDLDGVLTDTKDLHYITLNKALENIDPNLVISPDEHYSTYDGLSTTNKLKLLTEKKGLNPAFYKSIWTDKQNQTVKYINENYTRDERIYNILYNLKQKGYIIYVASNCIYESVKQILVKKGLIDCVDYFISNQDVSLPKPSPEIYMKCVIRSQLKPKQCLIIEDSPIGRKAAFDSGCHVMAVSDPYSYNIDIILHYIENINNKFDDEKIQWNGRLNILIPMAGLGSRFEREGYKLPKPLIEVDTDTPMIKKVVDNINCNPYTCRYIFVVQKSHYEKYCLNYILNLIAPGCIIVQTEGLTQGAACTSLLAEKYIDNDDHLLFANSDQILEWDVNEFLYSMISNQIDGGISTFTATDSKWSYAKLDENNNYVTEVAEKRVISNKATTGIYFWTKGSDFVKYAKQMISDDSKRVNNEFYVCPIFNEMIKDNKKIKIFDVKKMWGIGTPSDLNFYKEFYVN
jgi:HAD superfamily hydrolase (TIGR01509 family)